jgi:hypothetical protein
MEAAGLTPEGGARMGMCSNAVSLPRSVRERDGREHSRSVGFGSFLGVLSFREYSF